MVISNYYRQLGIGSKMGNVFLISQFNEPNASQLKLGFQSEDFSHLFSSQIIEFVY
jgi:hypothetical protein